MQFLASKIIEGYNKANNIVQFAFKMCALKPMHIVKRFHV